MSEEKLQYLEGLGSHFDSRLTVVEQQLKQVSALYEKILERRRTKEWLEEEIVWAQERLEQCDPDEREIMLKCIAVRKRKLAEFEGKKDGNNDCN